MTTAKSTRERFVEAGGIRMRVLIDGDEVSRGVDDVEPKREAVLVLHGFTGAAESMAGAATALSPEFQVVRLDLVGHGKTAAPLDASLYSMEACVAQIVAVVVALDLGRPHLLGYSMGGRAALSAAVAHPERFSSLTLVGATAGIADAAARAERIAADGGLAERLETEGLESFVDRWMALPLFASQARLGAKALAAARAQRLTSDPTGLANSLRGMGAGAQPPLHDRLDGLALPVLLVVGEEDRKFRAIAASLESSLANARTRVLPDAGHAAHLEAPRTFSAAVRAFLLDEEVSR